jgi:hypothetical protein
MNWVGEKGFKSRWRIVCQTVVRWGDVLYRSASFVRIVSEGRDASRRGAMTYAGLCAVATLV